MFGQEQHDPSSFKVGGGRTEEQRCFRDLFLASHFGVGLGMSNGMTSKQIRNKFPSGQTRFLA